MITGLRRIVATVLFIACGPALAGAVPVSPAEATELADAWGQAVRTGDVATLRQITGGALRGKRMNLWKTAGYDQLLIDQYGGSSFLVRSLTVDRNGRAIAIVAFESASEVLTKRLTIARIGNDVRVVDERMVQ